ncbi:MAG TPA: hypothetical protein VGN43_19060 [Steroidobacteraceae bacterium]|jgi:amino acid transporter|nr:hypothetical protein [Steroidobacteraceae bacterium]
MPLGAAGLACITLRLCLATLLLVSVMNLRGTADAGRAWAVPTYLFLGCFLAIIGIGAYRTLLAGGHPLAIVPASRIGSSRCLRSAHS